MLLVTIRNELGNLVSYARARLSQCEDLVEIYGSNQDSSAVITRNHKLVPTGVEIEIIRESGNHYFGNVTELDDENDKLPKEYIAT